MQNTTGEKLHSKKDIIVLAIESSCDETACAIVKNGREILSNVISTQIEIHRRFGGVVPEIASRNHTLAIETVVKEAIEKAAVTKNDIDIIAVTYGAGLLGALLVGVSFAKALAYAWQKPLMAVSHIKGHLAANYLSGDLEPPYVCLLVSGGNSAILKVEDYEKTQLLGATKDDAAGEAFDKVARILNLPYPGGPEIEKAAKSGKPTIKFAAPHFKDNGISLSFSGLKTAVLNFVNSQKQKGNEINIADIACSFQHSIVEQLYEATVRAVKETGLNTLAISGGVSANGYLRKKFDSLKEKGIKVYYPPLNLCTDNAAMIASAAYFMFKSGIPFSDFTLDSSANVPF